MGEMLHRQEDQVLARGHPSGTRRQERQGRRHHFSRITQQGINGGPAGDAGTLIAVFLQKLGLQTGEDDFFADSRLPLLKWEHTNRPDREEVNFLNRPCLAA